MRFRRILCPTDFSKHSEEALRFAIALARESGGALSLMHVGLGPGRAADPWVDQHLDEMKRRAEADGVKEVHLLQASGKIADEIVREARRGQDLVVLGTHGRTGLNRAISGSIAEEVVRRSPCPVLAVRSSHHPFLEGLSSSPPITQDIRTVSR